jgi:PAS domain S-box-containing protein
VGLLVVLAFADWRTGHSTVLIPLYGIAPLLVALGASVRSTLAIGLLALATALGMTAHFDDFGHNQGWVRITSVVLFSALAVWTASLRSSLEGTLLRERVLAGTSDLLTAAGDLRPTLQRVTELAVPAIADWAALDVLTEDRRIERVAAVHSDARQLELSQEFQRRYPHDVDDPDGVAEVLRTGTGLYLPEVTPEMLEAAIDDPERVAFLRRLRMSSVVIAPLTARGRTLGALSLIGESGRVLTQEDQRLAEELARRCALAIDNARLLEESQLLTSRYESLLVAVSDVGEGMMVLEGNRLVYANDAFMEMSGYALEELLALDDVYALTEPDQRAEARRRAAARVDEGLVETNYVLTLRRKDGGTLDVEIAGAPLEVEGRTQLVLVARDITARRAAEDAREGEARRFAFLADVGASFEQTRSVQRTIEAAAQLSVAEHADTCVITMLEEGRLLRVASAAADPERRAVLQQLQHRYPEGFPSGHPLIVAMREGQSVLQSIDPETIRGSAVDEENRALLERLDLRYTAAVPLRARDRLLGMMLVGFGEDRLAAARHLDPLELFEVFGRRVAMAIDNARLYEERSAVARTLQRSLLPPELPAVPHTEIAARYVAAGEGNEVGGDFYDCFATGDGDWAVVIGDVCGKGAEAAAVTALARYTIRASVLHSRKPVEVLGELNEALLRQNLEYRFCTALYASVTPRPNGVTVELATGGHPLPLVIRNDGSVETMGTPGTLLGIVRDPELSCTELDLSPGEALVLFTDGVIEASPTDDRFGPDQLAAYLEGCVGRDASHVAQAIERQVLAVQEGLPRDDVAVMVVRAVGLGAGSSFVRTGEGVAASS